jgi:hypothetical protein
MHRRKKRANPPQMYGCGDHGMARSEQRVDDAVPARRFGERAVDENDRRFHETLV